MANGDGYKVWGEQEVVSADQFQGYLQRQVVSSHVDTAARDTAITAVPEGHIAVARHTDEVFIGDQGGTVTDWVPFGRYAGWGTYTPALTATTTNPTLGTGAVQEGRFFRIGSLAVVHINLEFGTGMASGTGQYEVNLPTDCQGASALFTGVETVIGNGRCSVGSTTYHINARMIGANVLRLEANATTVDVDGANPGNFGDGDIVFCGTLTYETEPGAP